MDSYLTSYTKSNSEGIIGLNEKAKTIKLLEDIGKYLCDLGLHKIQNVCASEDTVKKMKTQATEGKEIFVNHLSSEVSISITFK